NELDDRCVAEGAIAEKAELGGRTEHQLTLPQLDSEWQAGHISLVAHPGRLRAKRRGPRTLHVSPAVQVHAPGSAEGKRRDAVVRRLSRPRYGCLVERSERGKVFDEVPILVRDLRRHPGSTARS